MSKSFIYAETAFHHEGDIDYLFKLIDAAAEAGADGIKFQVLVNFDELIAKINPAYETLRAFVFTKSQWAEIFDYAKKLSLSLIIMPLDTGAFELVEKYRNDIKFLEIHPISFNDVDVKQKIRETKLELILGAGGRTQEEISEAINYFGKALQVLMVGFQSFPSMINDIRIRKIQELQKLHPGLQIGYADHSSYDDPWAIESNLIAYVLGATIIEKHLTLQEGVKRVDFESAIGVDKLALIKRKLDDYYSIVYDYTNSFEMTSTEQNYRNRQKVAVASHNLLPGTILAKSDIALKMTGSAHGFSKYDDLIGKVLIHAVSADTLIHNNDVID